YDGQVKLVDFGVAKTRAVQHKMWPGMLKGKLAYMALEQLQAETVDRRADLFSVGVMLWEMLARRRMWHGKTEVEIISHLVSGRLMSPLPVLGDDVPTELDAICARALEADPARRYQTAAEMETDLERVLVGSADSHGRNLGKAVSLAFAAERAERQAIIERCLRRSAQQGASAATPSKDPHSLPTIEVPAESLEEETPVVPPPSLASQAAAHRRVTAAYVAPAAHVALAAHAASALHGARTTQGPRQSPAARPSPAQPVAYVARPVAHVARPVVRAAPVAKTDLAPRALRFWRAAAVAGLVATVFTIAFAVGSRRESRVASSTVAVAVPRPAPTPRAAITPPAVAAPAPAANTAPRPTGASGHDETGRPHRRHRAKPVDDDATLPPTGVVLPAPTVDDRP
ncbi:MAG TPA: protein kinase, partial [Polyangia bacterium]|nr:protein kinase [Polyangia bacterium]